MPPRGPREVDPFEVIGPIPKGKSYKWSAVAVVGDMSLGSLGSDKAAGWKPVPAKRHPKMAKDKRGRIVVRGQILVERSLKRSVASRAAECDLARQMCKDSTIEAARRAWPSQGVTPLIEPVSGVISEYHDSRWAKAKETLQSNGGGVPITIRLALTAGEMDTAVALGLTVEQYAFRKVLMRKQFGEHLVLSEIRPGLFDFSDLKVHHEKD